MKTSRLARETAKIGKASEVVTNPKPGSFAASINAFAAGDAGSFVVKQDDYGDNGSSLSSLDSTESFDIEDAPPFIETAPRKRKRGISTPATTVTQASSIKLETRTPPRKAGITAEEKSPAKIKKGRKQPARKVVDHDSGKVTIHPPANWEEIYGLVQEMRNRILAPVDTMGCESLAEDHRSPRVRHHSQKTPLLVATLLIQITGQTLPNPHRPNALLPNQRHHHRHRHEAPPNRTTPTPPLQPRRHPRCPRRHSQ